MSAERIALVTGANQGVGLEVATKLAANGVTVYLGSRDLARGEAAAASIPAGATAIQIDVTDLASIAAAAEQIRAEHGRLDLVVSNAGISNTRTDSPTPEEMAAASTASTASLDEVRAIWDVNASACSPLTRRCCHSCARRPTPESSTCRAQWVRCR